MYRGLLKKPCAMTLNMRAEKIVINGLGSLDNPNLALTAASSTSIVHNQSCISQVDERAIKDTHASGLTALNLTVGHAAGDADPFELTLREIAVWDSFISEKSNALRKVLNFEDILTAKAQHQVGLIYGLQNTTAFGQDICRVSALAARGVRIVQLTYNVRNFVGDGAIVADDQGLTKFGEEVIARLQFDRVLIDLSHSSEKTCLQAMTLTRRPMIISHSACRSVADHPRNKSDLELRRLAECGGVLGIYFMPYLRLSGQPHASDLLTHLEHAIDVCGEDHVGVGTDGAVTQIDDIQAYRSALQVDIEQRMAAGIGAPGETSDVALFLPDLCGVSQFSRLAELLAQRGHSETRIEKILGGNFGRVMREAWV